MRILLKLVIDCDADAAWRAVHSPRAVAELYGPLMELSPLVPGGLPTSWEPGDDVPVQLSLGGVVPMGRQLIHTSDRVTEDAERVGPHLPRQRHPAHRPAREPRRLGPPDGDLAAPGDPTKTLWRDRLVIGGPTALALWPCCGPRGSGAQRGSARSRRPGRTTPSPHPSSDDASA